MAPGATGCESATAPPTSWPPGPGDYTCAIQADVFEHGRVGGQVRVVDLTVELDDPLQFSDRPVQLPTVAIDHRDVVQGDGLTAPVANLPANRQCLLVVLQRALRLPHPVMHGPDVVQRGGFAGS